MMTTTAPGSALASPIASDCESLVDVSAAPETLAKRVVKIMRGKPKAKTGSKLGANARVGVGKMPPPKAKAAATKPAPFSAGRAKRPTAAIKKPPSPPTLKRSRPAPTRLRLRNCPLPIPGFAFPPTALVQLADSPEPPHAPSRQPPPAPLPPPSPTRDASDGSAIVIRRPRPPADRQPFLAPDTLAFLQYNVATSARSGDFSSFTSLGAGLRAGPHAFDIGSNLALGSSHNASARLTSLTYRRDWFDRRLFLTVGRTQTAGRGDVPPARIDGVRLSRQNIDEDGFTVLADRPLFETQALRPGVMSYRIGDKVYRQTPIGPGQPSVDPNFLAGLPSGGVIDLTFEDGSTVSTEPRTEITTGLTLFAPGTYAYDLAIGRVRRFDGRDGIAASASGRYGINYDATVGAATLVSSDSATVGVDLTARLPRRLGTFIGNIAAQQPFVSQAPFNDSGLRLALRGNYVWSSRFASLQLSGLINHNGGILAPVSLDLNGAGSVDLKVLSISKRATARINGRFPGSSIYFGADAEYSRLSDASRTVTLSGRVGGALPYSIGWNAYVQTIDSTRQPRSWSFGIGINKAFGSSSASLSYQQADGQRRITANAAGNLSDRFDRDTRYDVRVDDSGAIGLALARDFVGTAIDVRGSRSQSGQIAGFVTARGSIVAGGGHVTTSRDIGDTYVMLVAPPLEHAPVFRTAAEKPYTALDGNGVAALSNFQPYRSSQLRISTENANLGIEVPQNVLNERLQPHSGYIVNVAVKASKPLRLVAKYPAASRASTLFALIGPVNVPVEGDGSFYVESRELIDDAVTVIWNDGTETRRCSIDMAPFTRDIADAAINATLQIGDCK